MEVCVENYFIVISLFFLFFFFKDLFGCDGSYWYIVFRLEFYFKFWNCEDGFCFVFVLEVGCVVWLFFFWYSFIRVCIRFWVIVRFIEIWRCSGISWVYVFFGCIDVVKLILYCVVYRWRVFFVVSNFLNDFYVCCEKYK